MEENEGTTTGQENADDQGSDQGNAGDSGKTVSVAAVQDERRKRQAAERELEAYRSKEAERERADLEKRGEFETLLAQERAERAAIDARAAKLERDVILARRGLTADDAAGFAHYVYESTPADDRPEFAAFLDSELAEGGRLHRFVAVEERPKGTRSKQERHGVDVPAWIAAEADRRKRDGGALYKDVPDGEMRRKWFNDRYGGKDPRK